MKGTGEIDSNQIMQGKHMGIDNYKKKNNRAHKILRCTFCDHKQRSLTNYFKHSYHFMRNLFQNLQKVVILWPDLIYITFAYFTNVDS